MRRDTASSVTALASFQVTNRSASYASTRQIRTALDPATLVITLPYGSPLRLDSLYAYAEAIDHSKIQLQDAQGKALDLNKPLPMDAQGLLRFQVMAEDSSTQPYWLAVVRSDSTPPPYALSSFTIRDAAYNLQACQVQDNGQDSGHVYCPVGYASPLDLAKLQLYSAYGNDSKASSLLDAQGKSLASGSLLSLDAQGHLDFTLKHADGTTRPFSLSVVRQAKSSNTSLSMLTLLDGAYNGLWLNTQDHIDTVKGSIDAPIYYSHPINLQKLKLSYVRCSDNSPCTLLDAQGDTLHVGDALTLDAQGKASLKVLAEDGATTQAYSLTASRPAAPSASTALSSLTLSDDYMQMVEVNSKGPMGHRIDSEHSLIEIQAPSELSLHGLKLAIGLPKLENGYKPTLLHSNGDTVNSANAHLRPEGADTSFYFTVLAEDGKASQKYRIALQLAPFPVALPSSSSSGTSSSSAETSSSSGAEASSSSGSSSSIGTEALSPVSPSLALDWREALGSTHGEARLYALNGRLLWSATLPQSLAVLEDRRRAYAGPLMLRLGETFYRLPPLPR